MTDEETPIEGEQPSVEDVQKERDELKEKLEVETKDKSKLVSEIKELREKKGLSEAEVEELKQKIESVNKNDDENKDLTPEQIIDLATKKTEEMFLKRDSMDAEDNQKAALAEFQSLQKEFHPDNDEAGIKIAALDKILARFNMSGLKTKADFLRVYQDSSNLMKREEEQPAPQTVPHAGDNPEDTTPPREITADGLTKQELNIIDRSFDGDKERYLEIKKKRPEYVDQLLTGRFAH